jgi:gamma-glutamyltranspeptidase/glutathione hydrolase/leukotriene-C4 hydrolase
LCLAFSHFRLFLFFPLFHFRENRTFYAIDSREKAPMNANETMFVNSSFSSLVGGMASGVPGELAGFWKAHQLFGRLPWKRLFKPAIDYCIDGITVSQTLASAISQNEASIRANPALKRIFVNPQTDKIYKFNDSIKMPDLAETFKIISENGSQALYDGELSEIIVKENNMNG